MGVELTAERFVERLTAFVPAGARPEFRRAQEGGRRAEVERFGIRTGSIFELAKEFVDLPPSEIEELLDSPVHEVRVGALSVMDKQARRNRTPEARRKELFDLYLRRSEAIDTSAWPASEDIPRSGPAGSIRRRRVASAFRQHFGAEAASCLGCAPSLVVRGAISRLLVGRTAP